jgi:hypothetical protein
VSGASQLIAFGEVVRKDRHYISSVDKYCVGVN